MACLLLTADLLAVSRLGGAPSPRATPRPETLLELAAQTPAAVVVLDLSLPGLDVAGVVSALQSLPSPPAAIVAYGPHVQGEKLHSAERAGCTHVLTNAEFHARGRRLLAALQAAGGNTG